MRKSLKFKSSSRNISRKVAVYKKFESYTTFFNYEILCNQSQQIKILLR